MNGFKKCPNGHYYKEELACCPYCPGTTSQVSGEQKTTVVYGMGAPSAGAATSAPTTPDFVNQASCGSASAKTEVYGGMDGCMPPSQMPTEIDGARSGRTRTVMDTPQPSEPTHTVFGEEVVESLGDGSQRVRVEERSSRKLVGWLVSYSFDNMGVDFRIFEGRNTIGRDMNCNITVNDSLMSSKHALILYRDNKYKIRDEMSTHGTFVNGLDIEDEHYELHDGDVIKTGKTVFKFRTSL